MLETDIEGLDPKDATQYVLAHITTLKQAEKDLARREEEIAAWSRRVQLAESRGEAELAAQARVRLGEIQARKAEAAAGLADLRRTVSTLKDKLTRLQRDATRSIDTDLLLAQLEMVVGKKDELSTRLQNEQAGVELDELKRKTQP
jgi:phage shock protein A